MSYGSVCIRGLRVCLEGVYILTGCEREQSVSGDRVCLLAVCQEKKCVWAETSSRRNPVFFVVVAMMIDDVWVPSMIVGRVVARKRKCIHPIGFSYGLFCPCPETYLSPTLSMMAHVWHRSVEFTNVPQLTQEEHTCNVSIRLLIGRSSEPAN